MSLAHAFAGALLDPARPCPPGLRTWNGSDPDARFAVYRNNVTVSLVDALADTFDVTRQLVGDDFFRAMAREYVRSDPPRSRVLAWYGAAFPGFIAGFAPAATVPYLADVARLEWLRAQALHAADSLDPGRALERALADPAALPECRVTLQPAAGLLRSRHAVVSLWAAHQGAGDLASVDPDRPECALVVRPGLETLVLRLHPAAAEFVARLSAGSALGAAAQAAAADPDFDLAGTLALLLRHRAIASIEGVPGDPP